MANTPDRSEAVTPDAGEPACPAAAAENHLPNPEFRAFEQVGASGGATIHAIDSFLRLEPQLTKRSSCYLEALERLNDAGRTCVDRMESLMFGQRLRLRDCAGGELHLPNSVFECPEGQIWYHFSPRLRKFVLSFFHIEGRDGGLPIPAPVSCPGGTGTACNDDWSDGIAARLSSFLRQPWKLHAIGLDLTAFGGTTPPPASHAGPNDSESLLLHDIACAHGAMMLHEASGALPEWSLLGGSVVVRQQLQSPFARAIVVGEVMCRIGVELGDRVDRRALRWGPVLNWTDGTIYREASRTRLLEEITAIIDAVGNNSPSLALQEKSRHFLTASLMDSELMTDGLRLELVRSELIYRLAIGLASEVEADPERSWPFQAVSERHSRLMRKYALLSEFVRTSSEFFGAGAKSRSVSDDPFIGLTSCEKRQRPMVRRLARHLLDFSASTLLIINYFSGPSGDEDENVDREEMPAMSRRLSSIAAEIFDVPTLRSDLVQ